MSERAGSVNSCGPDLRRMIAATPCPCTGGTTFKNYKYKYTMTTICQYRYKYTMTDMYKYKYTITTTTPTPGSSTSGQAGPNGQGQQQRQGPGFENYDIPRNLGRQVCSTLIVLFDGWVHQSASEDELRLELRKTFTTRLSLVPARNLDSWICSKVICISRIIAILVANVDIAMIVRRQCSSTTQNHCHPRCQC